MSKNIKDKGGKPIRVGDKVIVTLNGKAHIAKINSMGNKIITTEFDGPQGPRIVRVRAEQVVKFLRSRPTVDHVGKLAPGVKVRVDGIRITKRKWLNGVRGIITTIYHYGEMAHVMYRHPQGGPFIVGKVYEAGIPVENLIKLKDKANVGMVQPSRSP